MPEQRVVVERHLAVERQHVAGRRDHEGVDLHQGGVAVPVDGAGGLHHPHGPGHRRPRQAQAVRQAPSLKRGQTDAEVDLLAQDELRRVGRNLLYLHAAGRARHDDRPRRGAVDQQPEVQLALDVERLLDQHARHAATLGTGLRRDERHPDQGLRRLLGLARVSDHPHAAALAPPAGMDLRLDDDAAPETLRHPARLGRRERDLAARHGQAMLREQDLRLVLVNLHGITRG